uniref:TAFA chemokine like family member 5 n=1 Tax=Spermophilus dauricus TaxID=99837 RepID=A0A8C9QFN4_SPEDA
MPPSLLSLVSQLCVTNQHPAWLQIATSGHLGQLPQALPCTVGRPGWVLAAGTCEIVTLDLASSQPRRTIARQTARCACRKGQIAGTTRARPACVDARIIKTKQWCKMLPCLEGEGCDLLINRSGWTCTQPGGRIKTTTVRASSSCGGIGGGEHLRCQSPGEVAVEVWL